jgi:hypothetical protein
MTYIAKQPVTVLKKDSIITCPECHRRMARVKNDINLHEKIMHDNLEGIYYAPTQYTAPICPYDGAKFVVGGYVHTSRGWCP